MLLNILLYIVQHRLFLNFLLNLNPFLNVISRQILSYSSLTISTSKLIISMITTLEILKNCYKILVCLSMSSFLHTIMVTFLIWLLQMFHLNLISIHFVLIFISLTTKQFVLILTFQSHILRKKLLLIIV